MDRGEIGGKLLLAVASLVVSALVVEVSFWLLARTEPIYRAVHYRTDDPDLRLVCYDDHFASTPDWDLRRAHPFGELTYKNNVSRDPALANLSPRQVPNAIEMRRDEDGLRERPMAAFDAERDKIVLLVGDSFGFGVGVRVVDRFSNVLETRLGREHPAEHYRIFNACKPGRNIKRIAEDMERYVEYFARVDRVVYSFVLNDPIRKGRLKEWKVDDFMFLRSRYHAYSARFLAGRDSYTVSWFALRLQRRQIAGDTVEWYRQLYTNNPHWPQTQQLLRQMKTYCSAKGIAFSLVVWPIFYQLDAYPLTEAHEIIEAVARQEGIHCVDLLPLFAGKDAREYWVHPTDFHPNSRAHAEAAAFLYDAIPFD